jgi:hypothetical protein
MSVACIETAILCSVTPCILVHRYQYFEVVCLHLFIYQNTRRQIHKDGNIGSHHNENLESHKTAVILGKSWLFLDCCLWRILPKKQIFSSEADSRPAGHDVCHFLSNM